MGSGRNDVGRCPLCGKLTYRSRKLARKAALRTTGKKMSVYPCRIFPEVFHVGHLPDVVKSGRLDRRSVFGDREPAICWSATRTAS